MAKKKKFNVRTTIQDVLDQAKDSFKIIGNFEKEALAKAKSFVKSPNSIDSYRLTHERILSGLRKLGVATQSEVETLKRKIQNLESSLRVSAHGSHEVLERSETKEV
jgi:polyhydroxyalkanoate synthesis regulator phasin